MNFYNEFDQPTASWLRNLIEAGLIPAGVVNETSITDIRPEDVMGYRQCHFFAGIAGWSEALRLAQWPENREVWTGSCPCQPFSAAGKQHGKADKRHLWPEFRRLIAECKPEFVFGEQVASNAGLEWFSGVQVDLEKMGYAVGAADLCAASIGAPHIRQRIFFGAVRMADSEYDARRAKHVGEQGRRPETSADTTECGRDSRLANTANINRGAGECIEEERAGAHGQRWFGSGICGDVVGMGNTASNNERGNVQYGRRESSVETRGTSAANRMGDSFSAGLEGHAGDVNDSNESRRDAQGADGSVAATSAWLDSTIIDCRDGKKRRTQSGVYPLAYGIQKGLGQREPELRKLLRAAGSNRKTRLKAYGNAIVPQLAALFVREFVASWCESVSAGEVK